MIHHSFVQYQVTVQMLKWGHQRQKKQQPELSAHRTGNSELPCISPIYNTEVFQHNKWDTLDSHVTAVFKWNEILTLKYVPTELNDICFTETPTLKGNFVSIKIWICCFYAECKFACYWTIILTGFICVQTPTEEW